MKDPEIAPSEGPPAGSAFEISNEPVVQAAAPGDDASAAAPSALPDADLLYVIARDPETLFLYWEVHWSRLFERTGLSARAVHLRTCREDGSVEATREINPFLGHTYIGVESPGTSYYGELGCFENDAWQGLLRSGNTITPEARLSDDLSVQFATLPMHLSFQRVLETIRADPSERAGLARSVAQMQESARAMPETAAPQKWARLISVIASVYKTNGAHSSDLAALLRAAQRNMPGATPTPDQLAQWRQLGESFGGASWGGASETGSGRSGPA
ncbi:hypothetical protein BH20VER3_BH20VER3_12830 [soil metagenome]